MVCKINKKVAAGYYLSPQIVVVNLKYNTISCIYYFFIASSTATATATVAPTMGLLPNEK